MGYGFIMGGGVTLDAKVISATSYANLPSSPDNTIGVITATAIPSYHFTDQRPAGRPNGEVRVALVGRGTSAMQVASEPIVSVYPLSVYQTDGANWTLMEAYLRSGGTWKRIRTYFYQGGALGLITSLEGYNTGAATYTIASAVFRVDLTSGGTNGFASVNFAQAIDISNVNTLKIVYSRVRSGSSGSHKARLHVNSVVLSGTNAGFTEGVASVDLPASTGNTVSLDVSALTGMMYVMVAIGKSSYTETDYVRVTEIWGE